MKTKKPISTISYNTEAFLKATLDRLMKNGSITEWYAIHHKAEGDEAGKKDHFHVLMFPNKALDETDVQPMFYEIDPNNEKPLKCLFWTVCNSFYDWHEYGIHDPAYLASKGLERQYHYTREDMLCSDADNYDSRWYQTVRTDNRALTIIREAVEHSVELTTLIATGKVPPTQNSRILYDACLDQHMREKREQRKREAEQDARDLDEALTDPATGEYLGEVE